MLLTYAMQLHRIPTGLYRQDTVLKVFQEIYWYIPYRDRHRQKETFSAQRFYCSKRIAVFPYVMTRHRWSLTFRTPASFRLIDPPKSSFIFKHQSDSFGLVLGSGIQHTGFNFFEASQTSSSAAFGCLERGFFCSSHVFSIRCRHTRAQYPCHRLHPKLF